MIQHQCIKRGGRLVRVVRRLASSITTSSSSSSPPNVLLLGVPSDDNSSFRQGAAKAPPLIRQTLHSDASNAWIESPSLNVLGHARFRDGGDLSNLPSPLLHDGGGLEWYTHIFKSISTLLEQNSRVLSLGGDHAISFPIVSAYAKYFEKITILHIDAHPDLYDDFQGNPYSHASPFARIMEKKNLVERLIQIGIRTMNGHQREQADRFNVEVVTMDDKLDRAGELVQSITTPVYLSLDLDGLDPAFAPGVSHVEPGGLSTRQVIDLIHDIRAPLIGADVVEYNPELDTMNNGMLTAVVAAKLTKEIAAKMLISSQ